MSAERTPDQLEWERRTQLRREADECRKLSAALTNMIGTFAYRQEFAAIAKLAQAAEALEEAAMRLGQDAEAVS